MKRLIVLYLVVIFIAASMPMTAAALNPYDSVMDLPPDQFTPEALLHTCIANNGHGEDGYYAYTWEGYADMAYYYVVPRISTGWTFELVLQGDCVEHSGIARAVFSDGTVINATHQYFSDGERITIVFPDDKVGQSVAAVISWQGVRGKDPESHVYFITNGYVGLIYNYSATSCARSPYAQTPRTGDGSIADIFYIDDDGYDRIRPNPDLDNPPLPTEQPSSWAIGEVSVAIEAGLIPQSLQSKYVQTITRAEYCALAVMLYEKFISEEIAERKTFIDTNDDNVRKMAAVGVVEGVGEDRFDPDGILNREQAATMLSRLAIALGKPLPIHAAAFADNGNISSWAIQGAGQVQAAGIMTGVGNNTFAPISPYTREQSIITMIRLWDIVKP